MLIVRFGVPVTLCQAYWLAGLNVEALMLAASMGSVEALSIIAELVRPR